MLVDFSDWSDRAIAAHVGVTQPFVGAVRNPETAERQEQASAKRAALKNP